MKDAAALRLARIGTDQGVDALPLNMRLVWPNAFQQSHFKQTFAVSLKIDEVEELWAPIATEDNWQPLAEKISAIRTMRAALDGVAITTMPKIYGGALLKD